MFRIKEKVWIINTRYIDGHYDRGTIVGIELYYDGLMFITERQWLNDFKEFMYKVAFINESTGRAHQEWIHCTNLSKTKPIY